MTLTGAESRRLLEQHGLNPSRAFGQNFVVDPNTVRRIARLAGVGPGSRVVEIGAGLGSLTLALSDTGAHVTALEIDRGLVPVLREVVAGRDVTVIEADALRVDWGQLLIGEGWTLVANLPYNVATTLVITLLEQVPAIRSMLVMVQFEVGERLAATPGSKAYGAVSVKVAQRARAEVVGKVPPTVFLPRPKVDSALVRLERHDAPVVSATLEATMFQLVHAGFAKRRKMLRGALSGMVTTEQFAAAGIDPQRRAEELWLSEWGALAAAVQAP